MKADKGHEGKVEDATSLRSSQGNLPSDQTPRNMEHVLAQIVTTAEMEGILHLGIVLTPSQREDLRFAIYRVFNAARITEKS